MNINDIKCSQCGAVVKWDSVRWSQSPEKTIIVYLNCKCGNQEEDDNLIPIVEKWLDIKGDAMKLKDFIENVLLEKWIEAEK